MSVVGSWELCWSFLVVSAMAGENLLVGVFEVTMHMASDVVSKNRD